MKRMIGHVVRLVVLLLGVVSWVTPLVAQHGARDGEWRVYGGDAGSTRYSPLDQIDASNVADLQVAWRWTTDNFGPRAENYSRVTPIMIDGVLYATAGSRRAAVAIDAATGETRWLYRFAEGERGENAAWANSGRGVAYWTDGDDARIFLITPGFHLIALNARTGRPHPDFGTDGIVDLKEGLDRPVDLIEGRIGSNSPPLVVNDVVVVGAAQTAGLVPPTEEMPPGHISGYDARTGERLWIFHTVPRPGEFGHDTWEQDSSSSAGNVGLWTPMSADEELGYIYAAVGAATGEYYGGQRRGDNLFSQSLVCLDAETGERVWHFQFVHHGIWGYDPPAPPIVMDLEIYADGRPDRVVVQLTKQAFTYIFDRETGDPLWPLEERPVPQTDLAGEHTSPTQPFPKSKPAPFDRQGMTLDDLIDFTPELRAAAEEAVSEYRLGPLFTPPSAAEASDGTRGTIQLPGSLGGVNRTGGSVDPVTTVLYIGSATVPSLRALAQDPKRSNVQYVNVRGSVPRPLGLPLVKPPWGRVTAIDMNAGEHVWMVPTGDTPDEVRDHPALQGADLPQTGQPIPAATLVTRRLLFVTGGWRSAGDPVLRAHDKKTGALIAEIELPGRPTAAPMTYQMGDTQYVAVMVGLPDQPAELVALTLP